MKITTLIENRTLSKKYKKQHGLSLYIETEQHKILFDTGADKSFVQNAKKLGIKLEDIDIVVISHGHSDHRRLSSDGYEDKRFGIAFIPRSAYKNSSLKKYRSVLYLPLHRRTGL